MARWTELETAEPEIASAGRELLYQGSDFAQALLATADANGHPRVHPVFPVLTDGNLWLFIVNLSPKYRDLTSRGHFALHSVPTPEGGKEFHLRGRVEETPSQKAAVSAATGGRQGALDFEALFRCDITSALYTHWDNWGTENAWPNYRKWTATSA